MGADYMDYILADRHVIPEDQHGFYTEKVVYLPDSYQINDSKKCISERTPTRSEAGLPEHGFVFCCFNNSHKITPDMFDVWMRLLRESRGQRALAVADATTPPKRNLLLRSAKQRGMAPERLVFAAARRAWPITWRVTAWPTCSSTALPYNAHTTASDALWAGLPVLTCLGTTFAGRVAASLLHAIGLPELITAIDRGLRGAGAEARAHPHVARRHRRRSSRSTATPGLCSIRTASAATSKPPTRPCGRAASAANRRRAFPSIRSSPQITKNPRWSRGLYACTASLNGNALRDGR